MPILLIILLSLLSNLMVGEPVYNLQRTNKYNVRRVTSDHRVPFFVKTDFRIESASDLHRIERQVEEDLHHELRQACFREKSYSKSFCD
jgi:hypothetical protein